MFFSRFLRSRFGLWFFVLLLGLVATLRADERIRIVASNLTSGNGQDYDPGHGNRILQGLQPDIVLVQEFNYLNNTAADLRAWVNLNFGAAFFYMREAGADQIPNGVVSRYPILASGEWSDANVSNRDFAWARIDIPGDRDLWVISVHLLTSSSANRDAEASQILQYIAAQGVPSSDYVVLGGDFNTDSRSESCIQRLSSYFVTSGPWPAGQAGNGGTNSSRSKPYDWVLADTDLHARRTPVVLGTQSFANGLVFDSRVYTPLPPPVLAGDSGASGMQHMAVVRDFLIPTTSAPPPPPVIDSAGTASGVVGQAFNHQIVASNNPTTYGASGLPAGLSVNPTSGLVSGTPTTAGTTTVVLSATNAGGTGTASLMITINAGSSGGTGGATLLSEDFASLTTGDDTTTGGSSTVWTGSAGSFPTVVRAFQAGGAVRLGSGSGAGSLTSKPLDLSGSGGAFTISFKVKGWTTVEGDISVTATGLAAQTVIYTNAMSAGYVTQTLTFTGGAANSTITISTSAGRAFIDDVTITSAVTPAITVTGTLAAVNTTYGSASPTPTSFAVAGTALTAGILVTPPSGFEVSQTPGGASGYAVTQTVGAAGAVAATTVYLRLAANASAGNHVGIVTCSSPGAASVTVAVASSTVAPRQLVVTALNRTKAFGAVFTAGTSAFGASGLVPGQTIGSVVLTAVGGTAAHDAAGVYSIFPSSASGGTFVASNYSITYVPGTLTVTAPDFAAWAAGLADATPEGDSDGDGVPNLLEYFQGLDPTVADRAAQQIEFAEGELHFDYRRSKAIEGVSGVVESSADLSGSASWSADEVTDELLEDFDLYETRRAIVPLNDGETKKFLRLRVGQP